MNEPYLRILDNHGNRIPFSAVVDPPFEGAATGRRMSTWGTTTVGPNASLYNSLSNDQMAPVENHAFPRLPLPLDRLNGGLEVEPPPLIKGYLKLGAKICSAPAWDPDFNTADVLTMLRLSEINPRYAKHFLGA